MKKKTRSLIILFLVITMLVGTLISSFSFVFADSVQERTIITSGQAEIEVAPDIAYINIGINTEAKDSETAQKENAINMNALMKTLKELKIEEKNIKTASYNLSPKYHYNKETESTEIVGYVVNNVLTVKVLDIANLGSIIDEVGKSKANIINGISFDVSNREDIYNDALKLAVKKAQDKALSIASVFGVKDVKVKSIIEQGASTQPLRQYNSLMMDSYSEDSSAGTSVSPGEIKIKATVNSSYTY